TTLKDYKGRPLAESMYQEVRVSGSAFAIYRLPDPDTGEPRLRYAYGSHTPEWDWVVMVSDDAQGVVEQFEHRRAETERAIADVLGDLRLAESGFAFIIGDDGRLISPPPDPYLKLLGEIDSITGRSLQGALHSQPRSADVQAMSFRP